MQSKPARLVSLFLLTGILLAGAIALVRPVLPAPEGVSARQAQIQLYMAKGIPPERYAAEPGENPEMEGEFLNSMGDYWAVRASYPTGVFDQQWLVAAAETDKQIQAALPAGAQDTSRLAGDGNLDPTQFTALGPQPLQSNGCQSCFSYGIVAGRTNVIVSDPISPNIAYAGSDGGGVWKTTNCCDQNTSWTVVTDDPLIASTAIGDLTLDPNDHNTIYAGTGDLRYGSWSFGSAGVLKSTDAGATWEVLGADVFGPNYPQNPGVFPQYQSIGKVRVDPRNSNTLVVTAKTGVYFSYDAGQNWDGPCLTNPHTSQRQDGTGLILHDNGTSTDIYVAIGTRGAPTPVQPDLDQNGANGIYHTTMPTSGCPAVGDWTLLTRGDNGFPAGTGNGTPNNPSAVGRIDMAMAPSDPNVIYAVVADTNLNNGLLAIFRTDNGGTTWIQGTSTDGNSTQNWYDQNVIVDPTDPMVIFVDMIDIWRSTNGGATVTNITLGYSGGNVVHVDHHGLAYVDNDPDRLLATSDGGAYYTDVATSPTLSFNNFVRLNQTLNTIEFYSGDITGNFNTSGAPGINGGAQDNGSMVKVWDVAGGEPVAATQWQMTTGGDGMFARIEPKLGMNWYQESQNGGLKRSTTGPYGTYVTLTRPWTGDRLSFIMPYELDKYNCPDAICNHMIVGTHRVWESINAGTTFLVNSPDLTKGTLGARSFIQQLSYGVNDGTIAIVGTLDGNVQYGFGLGQGVANSATWVNVTGGNAVLPNRPIMDVATHPLVPTIGFAAVGGFNENTPTTPGHVFQVTCNANCSSFTWEDKTGNLPNIPVNSIIANPNIPTQVFAGTDWGLYFTDDITESSPTWNLFTAGLPRVMIWDMAIDRGFTTLALFTRARGAYAWPLPRIDAPTIVVTPASLSSVQYPDTAVTHTLTISNTGTLSLTWSLTEATDAACAVPGDLLWLTATPDTDTNDPDTATPVAVNFDSTGLAADVYSGSLCIASNDPFTPLVIVPVTLTVEEPPAPVYGVELTAVTNTLTGTAGAVVTYTLNITNTGDITDSFSLDLSGNNWMSHVSPLTVTLAAATGDEVMVMVHVPLTATNNLSDTVTVTAVSDSDGDVSASVDLTTTAVVEPTPTTDHFIYLPIIVRPDTGNGPETAVPQPTANGWLATAVLPLFGLLFWRGKQ
ncbi:MAG TPA: hypothetical protein PLD25_17935 [Chloroflexota bacterium]|nr:hypothetical protein [Chloroflexota bacterium]